MEAWYELRKREYDGEQAQQAFLEWVEAKRPSRARDRQLREAFLLTTVPLMGTVMRVRFRSLQSADRDDVCSVVAMRLLEKIDRNRATFREPENAESFSALLSVTIRNLIFDYLRQVEREDREFPPEMLYRRPVLSIPKAVELQLITENLSDHITAFALQRDRFGFGRRAIHFVVCQTLEGEKPPKDTLRNWIGVDNPERCISFCVLMARFFLYKYRDKVYPVLEGELAEQLDFADMKCHVL